MYRMSFNSRAHGGRDAQGHRPDMGGRRFNSRAHGGRDKVRTASAHLSEFQFTRPRGARRPSPKVSRRQRSFNSRAHGGRDKAKKEGELIDSVSIHAPTGGATITILTSLNDMTFQFTRPRGARRLACPL